MPRSTASFTPHPHRELGNQPGAHVPNFLLVETISRVWEQTLTDLGPDVLPPTVLAVVRLALDYRGEVFVAPAAVDVDLVRVGRTSVELAVRIEQAGQTVVEAQVVVVHIGRDRSGPTPLTDAQRTALQTLAP